MEHDALVARRFGATAEAYLSSSPHATGEDLRLLAEAVPPGATVLDLGCGAGHASFAVAARAARVTALDLTPEMLEIVRREAGARGLPNVETVRGLAESLPFADASFDLVVTRFSAHHWHDVPRALREARRVLKPGGRMLAIDTAGGATPLLDTHLQAIELLRDPSHVRDYTASEWTGMLRAAGFTAVEVAREWPLPLDFASWAERMHTPPERIAAIHSLWRAAPEEVRQAFHVQPDGSFTLRKVMLTAAA
jgi:ubiquinone/menaquinone biosynthesis C-methylase UbiE